MLMVAMLTWGEDLIIQPVPGQTRDWVKNTKARFSQLGKGKTTDFILYDSGYLTPFHLDAWKPKPTEEEQVELFGNRAQIKKRRPAWDQEV